MIELGIGFWIQMIVYMGSLGVIYGTIKTELKYMKEKLDKHNSFQDRLVIVEQKDKMFEDKLVDLKTTIHDCCTELKEHKESE